MKARIRQKLLAAATPLAAELHYDEVSVAHLCAAAGVNSHDFKAAFGNLAAYFEALQAQFLDGLRLRMLKITAGTMPGPLRIKLASESYLSYCLEAAAVRRWLLAARAHPALLRTIRQQNQNYALLLDAELISTGCQRSAAVARLYLAMLNEVAGVELRASARQSDHRDALWHFLDYATAVRAQQRAA
jgi:AcrR family transcriptional regulator